MAKQQQAIQAIRGMHDILPEQSPYWQWLESQARQVLAGYGYQEIRLPIVEKPNYSSARSAKSPTSSKKKCIPSKTVTAIL